MLRALIISIFFTIFGLGASSYANISLSVNPIDGSSGLRFDKTANAGVDNKKGIRIRVSSSDGSRYQVYQRMLEPIVNEQGEVLNTQALQTQTSPNSNSYGTLYLQNSDHLGLSDQLVYTSGQGGQSDAFVIGYNLNQALINASGNFRGRLVFTLRGIGNASNEQVTIDVSLQTSSSFNVSVKGAHNRNRIRVRESDTTPSQADYLSINFSGNQNNDIRIYQVLDSLPHNTSDQELGRDVLQFTPQGNTEGLRVQGTTPLQTGRLLIYSGNKDEDSFNLYFLLNADKIQGQDSGFYTGQINYEIESGNNRKVFHIDIQCAIGPVFTVIVTPPFGGVSFSSVLLRNPPQEKEVMVRVLSNLHKPYQVIQSLQAGMTNRQGKEFDHRYFNFRVEIPPGHRGQTEYKEFSPVKTGEYPIFSSDARGSGASFKVVYRLQGYPNMNAGDFTAPISITLNQK